MADEPTLLACPFCGHTPEDWPDFLHPTGSGWRDDNLGGRVMRHYMRRDDPRGVHGQCWELGCLTHEGGCGATVYGDSREEAIAAWNRRSGAPNPTIMANPALEIQRLRYQADRLEQMGMGGAAENIREAADKLEAVLGTRGGQGAAASNEDTQRPADSSGPARPVPVAPVSLEAAEAMGAQGGPASEPERLAFEAWMKGHCWALCATWNGTGYVSDAEQGGGYCPHASLTRRLWAAWRDRAALAQPGASPNPTNQSDPLAHWIINNLLTDSQLDVVPPGQTQALRFLGR